ncbi:uncharacterized protein [Halyomorpha halys]|uniref:uncharacterized protein n=1 Tax=Halyomorpha halys TaxID=286706 RepID=UPI0006D4F1A9|nr:uncharacterized protein LOC106680700 [Halyomorpha halys]
MPLQLLWLCLLLFISPLAGEDKRNVGVDSPEQQLCEKMVVKFNTFVDMVPLILPITFPTNNDYFVGDAEVIFYPAEDSRYSPICTVLNNKDITMFRVEVVMRLVILNQGSRMEMSKIKLEAHLRLQKDEEHLFIDPQLVDVQIIGSVFRDGVPLDDKEVMELLRITLIKGFTTLASEHLSYSGSRRKAFLVDANAAAALFKQLLMSYVSQIV